MEDEQVFKKFLEIIDQGKNLSECNMQGVYLDADKSLELVNTIDFSSLSSNLELLNFGDNYNCYVDLCKPGSTDAIDSIIKKSK